MACGGGALHNFDMKSCETVWAFTSSPHSPNKYTWDRLRSTFARGKVLLHVQNITINMKMFLKFWNLGKNTNFSLPYLVILICCYFCCYFFLGTMKATFKKNEVLRCLPFSWNSALRGYTDTRTEGHTWQDYSMYWALLTSYISLLSGS